MDVTEAPPLAEVHALKPPAPGLLRRIVPTPRKGLILAPAPPLGALKGAPLRATILRSFALAFAGTGPFAVITVAGLKASPTAELSTAKVAASFAPKTQTFPCTLIQVPKRLLRSLS